MTKTLESSWLIQGQALSPVAVGRMVELSLAAHPSKPVKRQLRQAVYIATPMLQVAGMM